MTVNPGAEPTAPSGPAPGSGASEGVGAAPCSVLYKAPAPFQGHSLEGASSCDIPRELARSLDAEMPVDDLAPIDSCPVEPDMKFIVSCRPGIDGRAEEAALAERRAAYVESLATIPGRRRGPARSALGGCNRAPARQVADRGLAASVSARCIAPSFGSGARRIMSLVDPGTTPCPEEDAESANPIPGAAPWNALDLSGTAHRLSGAGEPESDHRTEFGRVANGWDECPFSFRERILDALSRDESVRPDWIAALGSLPSSPCRTTMPMLADAGGGCRHARGRMRSSRVRQLIAMLDCASAVV